MAAATQTVPALLTLDEYLRTSYHPAATLWIADSPIYLDLNEVFRAID